ncbi:hypothetical protein VTJ49DRAFT_3876 [Mycothermus thermophilus]|uniref:SIS domain-containing protein n=1 Tax=Humicola insolens TaxID=85995 RepID=A0ABR3VQY3_HUMIN
MVQCSPPPRPPDVQSSDVYLRRPVSCFSPPGLPSPPSPITPAEDDSDMIIKSHNLLSQPSLTACDKKLTLESRLSSAVNVLATETAALQALTELYSTDRLARQGFTRAVDAILHSQSPHRHGKVVVIGVGKSGHIARKLVATLNSLSVRAVFLHPTEALHGDLGLVSPHDTLLLVTFSGRTPELLTLLPHLHPTLPLVLLTGHARPETCDLLRHRPDAILLPAPVHEDETRSFGVAAPTTSTTVALAVADALALVVAGELHRGCVQGVFKRNHPGGAIGEALFSATAVALTTTTAAAAVKRDMRSVMVRLEEMPRVNEMVEAAAAGGMVTTGLDVLRAAYASPSGWLRLLPSSAASNGTSGHPNPNTTITGTLKMVTGTASTENLTVLTPRKIRRIPASDMSRPLSDPALAWLATPETEFVRVAAGEDVGVVAEWLKGWRAAASSTASLSSSSSSFSDFSLGLGVGGDGHDVKSEEGPYNDEAVLAVVEKGEVVGLLEVGRLLELA